jgi:hypothetical protein
MGLRGASLLVLVGMATQSLAADLDLTAAVALSRDDNLFRTPDRAGSADGYRVASLGAHIDLPVSAQHLTADGRYSNYQFQRFGEFDHDAWTARLAWMWKAGRRAEGQFSYAADSNLTSLANLQDGVQISVPNQLQTHRLFAQAGYGSRWQLRAAFERLDHDNSATEFRTSDMRRDGVEASLAYASGSGNRVGIAGRREDATLPNHQLLPGLGEVDNSYRQQRIGPFVEWGVTEKSRLTLRGGHVERSYRQLPQRDYDTWTWNVTAEWRPLDKVTLGLVVRDDLSEYEQVNLGLVTVKGFVLQPAVQLGQTGHLQLSYEHSDRGYFGEAFHLGGGPAVRERVQILGLDFSAQFTRMLGAGLTVRREMRAAGAAPGYRANVIGVDIHATF